MPPVPRSKKLPTSFDAGLKDPVKWGDFRRVETAKNGNHKYEVISTGKRFRKNAGLRDFLDERKSPTYALWLERYRFGQYERTRDEKWLRRMVVNGVRFRGSRATIKDRLSISTEETNRLMVEFFVEYEAAGIEERKRLRFPGS
jgi:hypothetical protein